MTLQGLHLKSGMQGKKGTKDDVKTKKIESMANFGKVTWKLCFWMRPIIFGVHVSDGVNR